MAVLKAMNATVARLQVGWINRVSATKALAPNDECQDRLRLVYTDVQVVKIPIDTNGTCAGMPGGRV